jgi:hypothetical protein
MANIKIAFINESTVLTDVQVKAAIPALQKQVSRDFAPVWGVDADPSFVQKTVPVPPQTWLIGVFDNSDQAGALGYHDLTENGLPLAKVFAGSDIQYKSSWTVTASHELLEMLGDPDINLDAFSQNVYPPNARLDYRARPHVGSRRERRATVREQWLRSTPRGGKRRSQ